MYLEAVHPVTCWRQYLYLYLYLYRRVAASWLATSLWQSPGTTLTATNPASAAQNPTCGLLRQSFVPCPCGVRPDDLDGAAEHQDRLSDRKVAKRVGNGVQTSKFQACLHKEGGEPAAYIRMTEAVGAGDGALRREIVPTEHERVPVWLKRDHAPASADHARHFPHHRARVVHVLQRVLDAGTREHAVCKGQRMGISGDEFRAALRGGVSQAGK